MGITTVLLEKDSGPQSLTAQFFFLFKMNIIFPTLSIVQTIFGHNKSRQVYLRFGYHHTQSLL